MAQMYDEALPLWVVIMFACVGAFGLGALIYIITQVRNPAVMPRQRRYRLPPSQVAATALEVIRRMGYLVAHMDENSISFHQSAVGSGDAAAMFPVIHVVIVPTDDGGTQIELIGARSSLNFTWHLMAQGFLRQLEDSLTAQA